VALLLSLGLEIGLTVFCLKHKYVPYTKQQFTCCFVRVSDFVLYAKEALLMNIFEEKVLRQILVPTSEEAVVEWECCKKRGGKHCRNDL